MADRQPESALAISFASVFPCQLHAHFGLSTDVLYFLAKQQSKREGLPQGYVIIYLTYPATSTTVLWLIHFLSTKMIILSLGLSKAIRLYVSSMLYQPLISCTNSKDILHS